MNKISCVVSSPIDTISGYGARSRDFVKSLVRLKKDEWDFKFLSQRWGATPFGALNPEDPEEAFILDNILDKGLTQQPDVWIQISVSNEFQPVGKFNIGVSALVEASILPGEMLEGLNRMNINIVSSKFSKTIAEQSVFDRVDPNTRAKIGDLRLEKPIEVLFEGVDVSVFKPTSELGNVGHTLDSIKESFCYLMVGHWLPGDYGEDRKQTTTAIKAFLEAFKDKKNRPGLILKTGMAGFSIREEEMILDKIDAIRKMVKGDLSNIYLLHGDLDPKELNSLYNHPKVKCLLSVGNEGFGRPALEFSAASSKLIIASPFSGHTDFLEEDKNVFVKGSLSNVHPSAANQFLMKEAQWFKVDETELKKTLQEVYEDYDKYKDLGKRQGYRSRTLFSLDKMTESLGQILGKHVPVISKPVALKLPKLAEIKKPSPEFLEDIK